MKINKDKLQYWRILKYVFMAILLADFIYLCSCAIKPISIKKEIPQLFVDDFLIESQDNLIRTLHQPKKDFGGTRPIIALEDEFSGLGVTLEANGTIVYDPKLQKYVMFALGFSPHGRALHPQRRWEFFRRYRFTSEDGLHWIKGDDGTPQCVYPRSKEDLYDPKSGAYATNIDAFSCYYDTSDPKYPYKGWQHFANWGDNREGMYFTQSKDGLRWQRGPMVADGYAGKDDPSYREIHQDGRILVGTGDVTSFYYDAQEDRFLGLFKFYSPDPVEPGNRLRSRAFAFLSSLHEPFDINNITRVDLVPPAAKVSNDLPYDEYYGSTAWRYGSLWLGGLKIWHSKGDYPWSAAGCAFLKLISSRDGLHWHKVPFKNDAGIPELFIANGPEGGNKGQNDGGYITEFSQGPLRIGDELIFYYGCSSWGKNHPDSIRISGGGIFRARLRIDGFVSVDGGSLTTKLLSFEGANLYLNAVGPLTVAVLDERKKILASHSATGDSVRQLVTFDGKRLAEIANGNPVHLRFTIGDGNSLYSFTVDD